MADLTGKNISDTYTRLVQVSESQLYDGAGGILPIQFDSENVIVSGTLTAQTYVVSESIVNASSGSTIFGNSLDDTHTFTGNITASNITASNLNLSDISLSGLNINANDTLMMTLQSAVPQVILNAHTRINDDRELRFGIDSDYRIAHQHSDGTLLIKEGSITRYTFGVGGHLTASTNVNIKTGNGGEFVGQSANITNITASGNISSSATLIANEANIIGNITASGDISASGLVKGEGYLIQGNSFGHLIGADLLALGYQNDTPIQIGRNDNPLKIVGNITASRNILATGSIHTLGHITASIISASGDIFGGDRHLKDLSSLVWDSGADNQTVISLAANHNLQIYSGSTKTVNIDASAGHITASGNISASGTIIADAITATLAAGTDNSVVVLNSSNQLVTDEAQAVIFGADPIVVRGTLGEEFATVTEENPVGTALSAVNVNAVATGDNASFFVGVLDGASGAQVVETTTKVKVNPSTGVMITGDTTLGLGVSTSNITASANISASGNLAGSSLIINSQNTLAFTNDIITVGNKPTKIQGNLTASGDISASGTIYAGNFHVPGQGRISFDHTDTDDQFIKGLDNSIIIEADDRLQIRADHTIEFQNTSDDATVTIDAVGGHISASGHITASGTISSSGNIIAPSYTGQVVALDRLNYYITINSSDYFLGRAVGVEGGDFDIIPSSPFSINDEHVFAANVLPVSMSTIGLRSGVRVSGGGTAQLWISTGSRADWPTADTVALGFGASGSVTLGNGQDFSTLDIPEFSIGDECDVVYIFVRSEDGDNPTVRVTGQLYGRTK